MQIVKISFYQFDCSIELTDVREFDRGILKVRSHRNSRRRSIPALELPHPGLQNRNVLLQNLSPAPLIAICILAVSLSTESNTLSTEGTRAITFLLPGSGKEEVSIEQGRSLVNIW